MYDIASREREVVENDKYYFLETVKKEGILHGGLVKWVSDQDKQDKYS